MSDSLSIRGPGTTRPLAGVTPEVTLTSQRGGTDAPQGVPPAPIHATDAGDVPFLPLPQIDHDVVADLVTQFITLRMQTADQQKIGAVEGIHDKVAVIKSTHEEIAKKLEEVQKAVKDGETGKTVAKVLTWVGVGLSVGLAVLTGGAGAIVAAAVGAVMATLNETGEMDKMTESIAKGLENGKPPIPADEAKQTAAWITAGINLVIAGVTIGASFASASSTVANLATKVLGKAGKFGETLMAAGAKIKAVFEVVPQALGKTGQTLTTATRVADSLVNVGQGATGLINGANAATATLRQASVTENQAFLRRLQQQIEDEQDAIQEIMDTMSEVSSKVIDILQTQSRTTSTVLQEIRQQTA
ncbi:MAG: type III secretion system translocon subunit SctE [Proteobacteria bacterium]|nr:type III secretion system translocon subunit SctE [Pseudomonadota bacterium]